MKAFLPERINKILIIKLRGIGDVVLSSVVFRNIKKEFPETCIDFLTEKPSDQFLEPLEKINSVILFKDKSTIGRLKLISKIRKEKYDLILDFYSNPFTAQLTFLSGTKLRAGFPYKGRKYAYNIYGPAERDRYHAADLHLKFLSELGLSSTESKLEFGLTEHDEKFACQFFEEKFKDDELVVGISPTGGWNSKKCPPKRFAQFADAVSSKLNSKVLIVWGPGEKDDAEEIRKSMKNDAQLSPQTTIREMGALIKQCNLFIANDSGPMHISTAVGTPTISINGPTDPRLQGPYGERHRSIRLDSLECIGCNLLECDRNHECFYDLPESNLINVVNELLSKDIIRLK